MITRTLTTLLFVMISTAYSFAGPSEDLLNAAQSGDCAAAQAAVKAGANINVRDANGLTQGGWRRSIMLPGQGT